MYLWLLRQAEAAVPEVDVNVAAATATVLPPKPAALPTALQPNLSNPAATIATTTVPQRIHATATSPKPIPATATVPQPIPARKCKRQGQEKKEAHIPPKKKFKNTGYQGMGGRMLAGVQLSSSEEDASSSGAEEDEEEEHPSPHNTAANHACTYPTDEDVDSKHEEPEVGGPSTKCGAELDVPNAQRHRISAGPQQRHHEAAQRCYPSVRQCALACGSFLASMRRMLVSKQCRLP